ncbi:mitogen-activated protein kinase kinase kinase 17-like [Wolffia australiana]
MGGLLLPVPDPSPSWVRRRCVGRGAFGTVSLAADRATGAIFAVKSVKIDGGGAGLRSLENEIEILRSVRSPWIVSYLGDSTTTEPPSGDTFRNLHLEYLPGGSAAALPEPRRAEPAVRGYARCVASALRHLHGRGLVHGDVKGGNVLVGPGWGEAKLADFGSACPVGSADRWLGTPLWMAPEVVRGGAPSPAADVWSLGCTVIELLTGKPPWTVGEAEGAGHVLLRIGLGDQVPSCPSELSSPGRDFLAQCLRRDPAERPSSEDLLRHPFLSGMSPRSVNDWTTFAVDSEEEDDESDDGAVGPAGEELKGNLRGLASSDGDAAWDDDDDWEEVRDGAGPDGTRGGEIAAAVEGSCGGERRWSYRHASNCGGNLAGDATARARLPRRRRPLTYAVAHYCYGHLLLIRSQFLFDFQPQRSPN